MNNSEILELAQHKLIILYIINGADRLFSSDELSKFILENNLINYFFLQQYIKELKDTKLLTLDNENKHYHITKDGSAALDLFISKIPEDIIVVINSELANFKKNKLNEQSVHSDYYTDDYGRFYVDLSLVENSLSIFSLNFEVPTEEYAINICRQFKESPDDIYLKIMNIFDINNKK